jgi:hypothetical protein
LLIIRHSSATEYCNSFLIRTDCRPRLPALSQWAFSRRHNRKRARSPRLRPDLQKLIEAPEEALCRLLILALLALAAFGGFGILLAAAAAYRTQPKTSIGHSEDWADRNRRGPGPLRIPPLAVRSRFRSLEPDSAGSSRDHNARARSQCWSWFHIDIAANSSKTPLNWAIPC